MHPLSVLYYRVKNVNIREMRKSLGDTQSGFAERYGIPFRTVQNWESGVRKPPKYVTDLLETRVKADLLNRRTVRLPAYDPEKYGLPKRRMYGSCLEWLGAVQNYVGGNIIFALDEALMCHGYFLGRQNEYVVFAYGDRSLSEHYGMVLLGEYINPYCVMEKGGIRFTDFNRTLTDELAYESIWDMQGTVESLSNYYANNESFNGISVPPEYTEQFMRLSAEAVEYYNSD